MKPSTVLTIWILSVWFALAFSEMGALPFLDMAFLLTFLYVWFFRLPIQVKRLFM
jgi:hypothetical protein